MNERVDAIVVGAGFAGSAAALTLARGGAKVVLVERSSPGASEHLPGGWMSGVAFAKLFPDWREVVPLEHRVVEQRIALLTRDGAISIDLSDWTRTEPSPDVFTVRRDRFDPWMLQRVQGAGGEIRFGVEVTGVSYNPIVGRTQVVHSGGRIECGVAIVATGDNGKLLPARRVQPDTELQGLHELYSSPARLVEERFCASGDRGVAMRFVLGFLEEDERGLGYLATYREGVSVGVLHRSSSGNPSEQRTREVLEAFKNHPAVAPLLRGLVKLEGGSQRVPTQFSAGRLCAPGQLFAGDAAGLHGWKGWWSAGWSAAIRSGRIAGQVALEAIRANDVTERRLESYITRLREEGLLKETKRGQRAIDDLWFGRRLHRRYPTAFSELLHRLMTETGSRKEPIAKTTRSVLKEQQVRWTGLLKDGARLGKGA